ncbi:hypothetical protein ACLKMH_18995 [Psychromonas sp. KJ10-10]|uniref:hypothetical protein n=1 Tax=Psychromonas sp. KJ10-10 TaxID=3391823 RepID=UPI0039B4AD8E
MKYSKYALISIVAIAFITSGVFFFVMYNNGISNLNHSTQDWGAFGSYIGGIVAPFASLIAGILVYQSLKADTYYRKLELIRESLLRLDSEFYKVLTNPTQIQFDNESNVSIERLIILISNDKVTLSDEYEHALISLLRNLAIISRAIEHYLFLMDSFDANIRDRDWLINTEKSYWVYRYARISNRLETIFGISKINEVFSKEEIASARYLGFISK